MFSRLYPNIFSCHEKRGPTPAKPRLVIEKAKPEEKAKIDIDRVVNTTTYHMATQQNDRLSVCAKAKTGIISER